jgi:hypothetical protein
MSLKLCRTQAVQQLGRWQTYSSSRAGKYLSEKHQNELVRVLIPVKDPSVGSLKATRQIYRSSAHQYLREPQQYIHFSQVLVRKVLCTSKSKNHTTGFVKITLMQV